MMKKYQTLWIILILFSSHAKSQKWCNGGSCNCERDIIHPTGFTCHFKKGSFFIEQDTETSWYLECDKSILKEDKTDELKSLNITIGEVSLIYIKDCNAKSYTDLLQALGIVNLKELIIKAKRLALKLDQRAFKNISQVYHSLRTLELKQRGVKSLSSDSLAEMATLRHMKIDQTSINELPEGLFREQKELATLTIFGNPGLHQIPSNFLKYNPNLRLLDLSMNSLAVLPENLLINQKKLQYLDLGSNNFKTIPATLLDHSCQSLEKFLMLRDSCFKDKENSTSLRHSCQRQLPKNFFKGCQNLKHFKYSFKADSLEDRVVVDEEFFKGTNLEEVTMRFAQLSNPRLLRPLTVVEYLDLSDNLFSRMSVDDIPDTVVSLRLAGNPFVCECDSLRDLNSLRMKNLMDEANVLIKDCPAVGRDNVPLKNATHRFCSFSDTSWQLTWIVVLCLTCLILISSLMTICISERVRVWMYNHPILSLCFCRDTKKPDDTDQVLAAYDAFISYAEEDSSTAMHLANVLEDASNQVNHRELGGRTYRCCCHQRDWSAGESILNNIIGSVERSHRTIILMSNDFLNSHWCRTEFEEAYKRNKLIVILLDGERTVKEQTEASPVVKSYVTNYTCLKIDDPQLWKRLAYHLPHKPLPKMDHRKSGMCRALSKAFRSCSPTEAPAEMQIHPSRSRMDRYLLSPVEMQLSPSHISNHNNHNHPESPFTNNRNELQYVGQCSVNENHHQAKEGTNIVVQLNNANNTNFGTSVNILSPASQQVKSIPFPL